MFSNIMEIQELTVTFLGSLEDMLEICEEKQDPAVGSCFEELAEVKFLNLSSLFMIYYICFL